MTAAGTIAMRGECRYCGRDCALRADGTVRGHALPGDQRATVDRHWCEGSNRPPRKASR